MRVQPIGTRRQRRQERVHMRGGSTMISTSLDNYRLRTEETTETECDRCLALFRYDETGRFHKIFVWICAIGIAVTTNGCAHKELVENSVRSPNEFLGSLLD